MCAKWFTKPRPQMSRFRGISCCPGIVDVADLYREACGDELEARQTAEALPEQREIVELKHYAELSLREIAEITALPQGTVATRYRTALGHLRDWLKRKCHE